MRWESVGIVLSIVFAVANFAYVFGVLSGKIDSLREYMHDELTRARDRVDQMEKDLRDWLAYWKRQ